MHVLLLVKFFSFSTFLDRRHNIYGNDFLLSMQLQTTSSEATMALGGTAVEFEQSLNFYAGWRKYFIIQIFLFYVFQIRIIQFVSILLFSFGALVFSVRDKINPI